MNIALIGYGKMGKTIHQIAEEKGHKISFIIDQDNLNDFDKINKENTDVAIEFTRPDFAIENYKKLFQVHVPVVSGTTGWLDNKAQIDQELNDGVSKLFYASNFSIGVNIFFKLNKQLAKMMNNFHDIYQVSMEEIHHLQKLDAPSGTAITLAEGVIEGMSPINGWTNEETKDDSKVDIISKREPEVPGTHSVTYSAPIDTIEIKHTAHNRLGFAGGAVAAAEWVVANPTLTGWLGMDDMLNF